MPRLIGVRFADRPSRTVMLALLAGIFWLWLPISARAEGRSVVVAEIKGAIGVGTGYHVTDALAFALREQA